MPRHLGAGRLKCDGTRAETRFRLSAKRTIPFKSAVGVSSVDYCTAEVWASAVVMLDTPCSEVVWRVLATHCIRQFPPSLPLPCVTVCHHISTGVYTCAARTFNTENSVALVAKHTHIHKVHRSTQLKQQWSCLRLDTVTHSLKKCL